MRIRGNAREYFTFCGRYHLYSAAVEKQEADCEKIKSITGSEISADLWWIKLVLKQWTRMSNIVFARYSARCDVLGGHHSKPKCAIILHGGNFPHRRTLESF